MGSRRRVAFLLVIFLAAAAAVALYFHGHNVAVLDPKGTIASKERHLIIISTLLMLIVVIPVYILTFSIAWKYRESNKKAKYSPDWDHHFGLEFLWWALPSAIILVLAVVTYKSSHELDPYRPLASAASPLKIQVIALDWKWLFVYPKQNIASVNFFQFPVNTPLNFEITSDAPMNSFWIPRLGGQIYAMSGMSTQLHLMADSIGSYRGSSANISGRGFAGMSFVAKASSSSDFDAWVQTVRKSPNQLSLAGYSKLAEPSENNAVAYYSSPAYNLYDSVIMKFMQPGTLMRGVDNYVAEAR